MKSLESLVEVFSEESTHTVERAYVIRKTGSLLPATGVFLWSSKMGEWNLPKKWWEHLNQGNPSKNKILQNIDLQEFVQLTEEVKKQSL